MDALSVLGALLGGVGALVAYVVVMRWILPRFGVRT